MRFYKCNAIVALRSIQIIYVNIYDKTFFYLIYGIIFFEKTEINQRTKIGHAGFWKSCKRNDLFVHVQACSHLCFRAVKAFSGETRLEPRHRPPLSCAGRKGKYSLRVHLGLHELRRTTPPHVAWHFCRMLQKRTIIERKSKLRIFEPGSRNTCYTKSGATYDRQLNHPCFFFCAAPIGEQIHSINSAQIWKAWWSCQFCDGWLVCSKQGIGINRFRRWYTLGLSPDLWPFWKPAVQLCERLLCNLRVEVTG